MTNEIFDGVLFARKKSEHTDWVPHTRNGQPWRKRRVSGPGGKLKWHYEPVPAESQPVATSESVLSDAQRMINDPGFDWNDHLAINVLRDALTDEGRVEEANLLAVTPSVNAFYNGKVVQANELPAPVLRETIMRALGNNPVDPYLSIYGRGVYDLYANSVFYEPRGSVQVRTNEYRTPNLSDETLPGGPLLAAARKLRPGRTGRIPLADLRREIDRIVDERAKWLYDSQSQSWSQKRHPNPASFFRGLQKNFVWAHLTDSRQEASGIVDDHGHKVLVEFRSFPLAESGSGQVSRWYYAVSQTVEPHSGAPYIVQHTNDYLSTTLDEAVSHVVDGTGIPRSEFDRWV